MHEIGEVVPLEYIVGHVLVHELKQFEHFFSQVHSENKHNIGFSLREILALGYKKLNTVNKVNSLERWRYFCRS